MIVTHNFNSKNVIVSAYDNSDFYFVPQSIKLIDDNNVKLTFTSPSTGYVVVAKGGHLVSATGFQGNQGPQGAKGEIINGLLYTTTISGSIITINHNTNNIFPLFSAYNKDKIAVQPKKVLSINSNTIEVDFGTFFTGSISVGGSGIKGIKGLKGEKGNFKGEKGDKGNDIFPFTGAAIITGSLNVSNSSSFSHILPKRDNFYDLGSPNRKWRDLYLTSASIYLDKVKISTNNQGRLSIINSENPSQKTIGDYSGSFTGSIKLPNIPLGTSETNIVLVNGGGGLVYRSNLSLTGPQGFQGRQGPIGVQGTDGTVGTNGAQGPQGNQGPAGIVPGVNKIQFGKVGITGATGTITFPTAFSSVPTVTIAPETGAYAHVESRIFSITTTGFSYGFPVSSGITVNYIAIN